MKNIHLILVIIALISSCNGTKSIDKSTAEEASIYFKEIEKICNNDNGKLLGFKLSAPILYFDSTNRALYANQNNNNLEPLNDIFIGTLPKNITIDGSYLTWHEKKWLVFNLPTEENKNIRIQRTIAALVKFHEEEIGLNMITVQECEHLKKLDNIYWLKMEAEALKMTLISEDESEQIEHLRLALASRKMRKLMSINMFDRENNLDLKEGIPELTGYLLNELSFNDNSAILYKKLDDLQKMNSVEHSFSKIILPSYGLIMSKNGTDWVKKMKKNTDILNFIINHYQFQYLESFSDMVKLITEKYHKDEFKQIISQ